MSGRVAALGLSGKVRAWHRLTGMSGRITWRMREGIWLRCKDVVVVDRVVDGCSVLVIVRRLERNTSGMCGRNCEPFA